MRIRCVHKMAIALFLMAISFQGYSTHTGGIEMFYRWVPALNSDSTYEFTTIYFANCLGSVAGPPFSMTVSYSSASKNISGSFNLSSLPSSGTGVPPSILRNLYSCSPGSYCIGEHVFRGNWTSPAKADDWIFSTKVCCTAVGNSAPTNIAYGHIYTDCGLDNLNFPDSLNKNNSPFWHNRRPNHPGYTTDTVYNLPFISTCHNRYVDVNQSVREYDGDFLKYEFINPRTNNGVSASYINGWTLSNPLPVIGGPLSIDSLSGEIAFVAGVPTGSGIYTLTIKVTEFRNDTTIVMGIPVVTTRPIGFNTRNLQIIITDTITCMDNFYQITDSLGNNYTSPLLMTCDLDRISFGFSIGMKCTSLDSTGSDFLIVNTSSLDTASIQSATAKDCGLYDVFNIVNLQMDSNLIPGNYNLYVVSGIDSNTLITICEMELDSFADTLKFTVSTTPPLGILTGDSSGIPNDSVYVECGRPDFDVYLTEFAFCNSVDTGFTDFILKDLSNGNILAISDVNSNCLGNDITNKLTFQPTITLPKGLYELFLVFGNDGNSLVSLCNQSWDTSRVVIVVPELGLNIGPDFSYCFEDGIDTTIYAQPGFNSYLWQDNSTALSKQIIDKGNYWCEVTNVFNCVQRDYLSVAEKICYSGIHVSNFENEISIFPNPNNGEFTIKLKDEFPLVIISVWNNKGQEISSKTYSSIGIIKQKIEGPTGLYLVKIESENGKSASFTIVKK